MKVPKPLLILTTTVLLLVSLGWAADDNNDSSIDKRIDKSAEVLSARYGDS